MKRLLAIAASAVVLLATACGNTRVLPLSELLSADREELTPEQWDMKKQLFGVLVDKVEIQGDSFVLGITKTDFTEQGLPAAYYKELQKSIKDMNNFISKTDDTNHLTESELRELWDAAIKTAIEVEPLYAQ